MCGRHIEMHSRALYREPAFSVRIDVVVGSDSC